MFDHHDSLCQPDGTRPPQLNQTVCGCRCGRGSGSGEEGDGESKDEDAVSTLVASDSSDVGEDFASSFGDTTRNASFERHLPSPRRSDYIDELRARIERFINGADEIHQMVDVENPSQPPGQFGFLPDYDADSMRNEPGSDVHSIVASDGRSVHCISPGPGIGDWTNRLPREYHFLGRPLRLTPQHRYCRGLVASHLVLRDHGPFGDDESGRQVDGRLHQASMTILEATRANY